MRTIKFLPQREVGKCSGMDIMSRCTQQQGRCYHLQLFDIIQVSERETGLWPRKPICFELSIGQIRENPPRKH